ncbi:fatty acid elongase [Phlyctochytrium arcticum]|nr:fatty acid elongase [Phlyctochytrium arcticum]
MMDLISTALTNRTLAADALAAESFPLGSYYPALMNWRIPVFTATLYFLLVKLINPSPSQAKASAAKPPAYSKTAWFKALVFAHNVALCVFSVWTFLGMMPAWVQNLQSRPIHEAFCDRNEMVWNQALFKWSWLFYLSKYYEIFDTIIILLKGRRTSLLQSYHHAGAILSMWLCVYSHATGTWIFVLFNSFIHSIMYFYYAATTLGYKPPGKQYLTRMQITQFLVGGTLAMSYPFIPGCLKELPELKRSEVVAYSFTIVYLFPLTALFVNFARKTYGSATRARSVAPPKKDL